MMQLTCFCLVDFEGNVPMKPLSEEDGINAQNTPSVYMLKEWAEKANRKYYGNRCRVVECVATIEEVDQPVMVQQ